MKSWCYENNCSCQLFSRKRSIVDIWQGSEYSRVLNIPRLWICFWFWIYLGSKYAKVTEGSQYGCEYTCLICLNMPEYAAIYLHLPEWLLFYTSPLKSFALGEKCPNTENFWSVFSCIQTEYGDFLRKSPYSVRIQENTDQKQFVIWTLFTQCCLKEP